MKKKIGWRLKVTEKKSGKLNKQEPLKYYTYLIIGLGELVKKMAIFAYYQYIGSEKDKKPGNVIFEWSPTE